MDKGKYLVIGVCVIIVGLLAAGAPFLYTRIRQAASSNSEIPTPAESVRIRTHDEVLGPPLSFETPAYIRIPAIGVDEEVREGSDNQEELYATLALGPVHIKHTAFPGQKGNCVISGHRTTHTRPFNRLDELKQGDVIYIDNPRGRYQYAVFSIFLINPSENVTLPTEEPVLTLTTCHPEGEATHRLVVRAGLTNFTPIEYMNQ
jgi:sortase A